MLAPIDPPLDPRTHAPGAPDVLAVAGKGERPVVIVVGSVNVDLVMSVPAMPASGETVIGGRFSLTDGGKGANQATVAARLGAQTWMVGCVGPDDFGVRGRAALAAAGVHTDLLLIGREATGVATILVDAAGENTIAVASGANSELDGTQVRAALRRIDVPTAVVLACLEVPDEAVQAAAAGAAERGWSFILNPAPARPVPTDVITGGTILTPNARELPELGYPSVDALLASGAGAVIVTRGADGVDVHVAGGSATRVPAFPVAAVDTTGAGDAFSGTLAWAMASGRPLADAVVAGAAAGALATRAVGARGSLPDAVELTRFFDRLTSVPFLDSGR